MHSAYEECRADTVAYFLATFDDPMNILFKGREKEWEDIVYMAWLSAIIAGIKSLKYYDPESKKWL